ncbi:MAG: response regulator transcription factor [Clostridiales bacterium]|nr:response regulator transcription factor [Clostridiales bacterium]
MKKLICVEDDENISELLAYTLASYGFEVSVCPDAGTFYASIEAELPDLVLLDIMLPDEDGTEILKKLRKRPRTARLPVIMLTAKSSQLDKIKGLDGGADDYITKPFDIMELISRINAVLRRTSPDDSSDTIDYNGLIINPSGREVFADGKKLSLTYKEFELLYQLVTHRNKVLTRDVLMNTIWGTNFEGETRTVDVHIRTLRQKLGDYGRFIKTVRNVGYMGV